jgi:hypothetical protein
MQKKLFNAGKINVMGSPECDDSLVLENSGLIQNYTKNFTIFFGININLHTFESNTH